MAELLERVSRFFAADKAASSLVAFYGDQFAAIRRDGDQALLVGLFSTEAAAQAALR